MGAFRNAEKKRVEALGSKFQRGTRILLRTGLGAFIIYFGKEYDFTCLYPEKISYIKLSG